MTTDTTTRTSLKERALAAWREREERGRREQAERDEREKGFARQGLEQAVRDVLGDEATVTDVTFHRDADDCWVAEGLVDGTPTMRGRYGITMRFPCLSCGLTTVVCSDCSDLTMLGRFLAARDDGERWARTCGACWTAQRLAIREQRETEAVPSAAPSVEEQLLLALRAFVAAAQQTRLVAIDGDPEF